MKKILNTFLDQFPTTDILRKFFFNQDSFFEHNNLGFMKLNFLKKFLYEAEILLSKTTTLSPFGNLVKKLGWSSSTTWSLILVNLVFNNPQFRWYVENLPLNEFINRKIVEAKLKNIGLSYNSANAITKTFRRICSTPLGTVANFGRTQSDGFGKVWLKRTTPKLSDGRIMLYALYKFAVDGEGQYQFNLSKLYNSHSTAINPTNIFSVDSDEMQQILNGLSTNFPELISTSFTHDLEKISLKPNKYPHDILKIFYL